jgi:translation elongation factor P/translation initiation factor 5A
MKKFISFLIIWGLFFSLPFLGECAQTSSAGTVPSVTLKFTNAIESAKCKVTSIKASKSGGNILFSMNYESDAKRNYRAFSPPSGDIFDVTDTTGLPAGKHSKTFKIAADKLCQTTVLTISLYKPNSSEMNFVFVDTVQLSSLMSKEQAQKLTSPQPGNQEPLPSVSGNKAGEFNNVKFDLSIQFSNSIASGDCRVTSLKAGKMGDYIAFSMDYESGVKRDYCVFNPPSGDLFKLTDAVGLPAGKGNKKFKVEASKISQTSEITISLYRQTYGENNFIFFPTSQLSQLDNPTGAGTDSVQQDQSRIVASSSPKKEPGEFDDLKFDLPIAFTNFMQRPECIVTSLKAARMDNFIVFSMDYESDVKRNYSCFSPSPGNMVNVSDSEGLPAGKQNKKFKVELDRLSKTSAIAIRLYKPGSDERYCISFATSQLVTLMNQKQKDSVFALDTKAPATERDYSEFNNVSFDVSISYNSYMESHDCRVTSLKAGRMGNYIAFSLDYESEVLRGYSIFDPPYGNLFIVADEESLPAGKHNAKFKVEASKLRMADSITIKLFRVVSENNAINFRPSQLSSLLN